MTGRHKVIKEVDSAFEAPIAFHNICAWLAGPIRQSAPLGAMEIKRTSGHRFCGSARLRAGRSLLKKSTYQV